MNYSEVKELLSAGFNAEEIRQMLSNPAPDPEPTPEPAPDPEPTPAPEPAPEDTRFTQLNDTMTRILRAIQGNNLQNNSFDNKAETDIDTQVDNIMGSLIRPERKKGD